MRVARVVARVVVFGVVTGGRVVVGFGVVLGSGVVTGVLVVDSGGK